MHNNKSHHLPATTQQLLKLPSVVALSGNSRSSIYEAIKKGEFPAPIINIGPRGVAWTSSTIAKWQYSCLNAPKSA